MKKRPPHFRFRPTEGTGRSWSRLALATLLVLSIAGMGPGSANATPLREGASRESGVFHPVLPRIESEARRDDPESLRRIARELDRTPSGDAARDYARSVVAYRLAMALDLDSVRDRKEMSAQLGTARELLEGLLDRTPDEPEATALLVAVLGRQIALRPAFLGMFLGRRANGLLESSAALHPDHPRLTLQEGILAYFTPSAFGGGPEASERRLRRALELLSGEEPGTGPGWGRMDTLIWLGRVLEEQGRTSEARPFYAEALGLAPGLAFLRSELAELE